MWEKLIEYYQEEMRELRAGTEIFLKKHPEYRPMLSGSGADPDFQCLMQGTAFQNAMTRLKLDDAHPEIIEGEFEILWPQFLRPIPAASTVAFTPQDSLADSAKIPAGSIIGSRQIEQTTCFFTTCYDVEVHPLTIQEATFEQPSGKPAYIRILMDLGKTRLADWQPKYIRFFLGGEYAQAADLYYLLMRHLKNIIINPLDGGNSTTFPGWHYLKPVGLGNNDAMMKAPKNILPGYRIMREYFFMPEKFLYVEFSGWKDWPREKRGEGSSFELCFELDALPFRPAAVTKDDFVLHATPVVNVFPHAAKPILIDKNVEWYQVEPDQSGKKYCQVFSIEKVLGTTPSSPEKVYEPGGYYKADMESAHVYTTQLRQPLDEPDPDLYISINQGGTKGGHEKGDNQNEVETISLSILCTNGRVPEALELGDISVNVGLVPQFVDFKNIKPVTPAVPPPASTKFLWQLLKMKTPNSLAFSKPEIFRALLALYKSPQCRVRSTNEANNNRINGIEQIQYIDADSIIKGDIRRGREVTLGLRRSKYSSFGDMFVFASAIDVYLSGFVTGNFYTRLIVNEIINGNTIEWEPQMGKFHSL